MFSDFKNSVRGKAIYWLSVTGSWTRDLRPNLSSRVAALDKNLFFHNASGFVHRSPRESLEADFELVVGQKIFSTSFAEKFRADEKWENIF